MPDQSMLGYIDDCWIVVIQMSVHIAGPGMDFKLDLLSGSGGAENRQWDNLYLLASQFILSKKYEGDSHARGGCGSELLGNSGVRKGICTEDK